MSVNVFCFAVHMDSARFSQPILKGDVDADKVIMIHTDSMPVWGEYEEEEDVWFPAWKRLEMEFESFDIPFEKLHIPEDEFWEPNFNAICNELFNTFLKELVAGNQLYLNVSSEPSHVNYAIIYTALTLQQDLETDDRLQSVDLADINFYISQGHSYHVDVVVSLENLADKFRSIENAVDRQRNVWNDIRGIISETKQKNEFIFENDYDDLITWQNSSLKFDEEEIAKLREDISEFCNKYSELIESAERLQHNSVLGKLSNSDLKEIILDDKFAEFLDELSNSKRQNQDHEFPLLLSTSNDHYELIQAVNELDIRISDIEDETEYLGLEVSIDILKEEGSSRPSRYHPDYPIPPLDSPEGVEVAILIALYLDGSVSSITELMDHLVRISMTLITSNGESVTTPQFEDREVVEVREKASRSIRSKIQYNLNQLESKGFIRKKKKGRASAIDLTANGSLWLKNHGYKDFENCPTEIHGAFEGINDKISEHLA